MSNLEECLFHTDKLRFEKVVREIQKAGFVPRSCIQRLAMAVCTCKRRKTDIKTLLGDTTLECLCSTVKDMIAKAGERCLPSLREYLNSLMNSGLSLEQPSPCLLLFILKEAHLNKKYDLLQRNASNANPASNKKPQSATKLTQKQYDLIMRKKIKRMTYKEEGELPVFPGNLKKMKTSDNYIRLIKAFKTEVVLQYNSAKNEANFNNKVAKTCVIYHYNVKEQIKVFRQNLHFLAKSLQDSLDHAHWERIKKYRQARRGNQAAIKADVEGNSLTNSALAVKENRTDDFLNKRKMGSGSKKGPSKVLEGGHCLHCLKPFEGVVASKTNDCVHHPGFIKYSVKELQYIWTCCDGKPAGDKPTHQDHLSSGCTQAIHLWRQRKPSLSKLDKHSGISRITRIVVKPKIIIRHSSCSRLVQRALENENVWF